MKKLMALIAILAASASFAAILTNELGQVVVTGTNDQGVVTVSTVTAPGSAVLSPRTGASILPPYIDTNAATTVTSYTPRDYGQLLVGKIAAETSAVWVASRASTNGWILIGEYTIP